MQNHGRLVSGRQIVWMIWDHNRTAREMDVVYDITHLTNLQWFGDSVQNIHKYRTQYNWMMANCMGDHKQETFAEILIKQMRKSRVLSQFIVDYENKRDLDPTHDLRALDRIMERYVQRKTREANDDQRNTDVARMCKDGWHAALPGQAGDYTGKGKGLSLIHI